MVFCEECGTEFEARAGTRFCSSACRVKAHRAKPQPLTAEDEQALRDELGFTASESRSKAERDEAAKRMLANTTPPGLPVLPENIARVWASDPLTAQMCVQAWGLEVFRDSALHRAALAEIGHREKQRAYREARRREQKVPSP